MASSTALYEQEQLIGRIESVPNLRLLCTRSKENIERDGNKREFNGALYRSSKPDRITAEDVVLFRRLGIKTIVDFRSLDEYRGSDGLCFLDKEYSLYKVNPSKKGYKPGDEVEAELVAKCDVPRTETFTQEAQEKRHFLINFFSASYALISLKRVPWYIMLIGILHLVYDFFKKNKMKTFIAFFIKHSVNRGGIVGQYQDIVDVSGSSICAALKLISNPENMPVMINCAHGKDRTGILSALILSCLGMPEEYVIKEYTLSAKGLESIQHIMYKEMIEKLKLKEDFCKANAETMLELITYIKQKYGSIQKYLTHIGFNSEDQQRLRDNLIPFENEAIQSYVVLNGSSVDVNDVNI